MNNRVYHEKRACVELGVICDLKRHPHLRLAYENPIASFSFLSSTEMYRHPCHASRYCSLLLVDLHNHILRLGIILCFVLFVFIVVVVIVDS